MNDDDTDTSDTDSESDELQIEVVEDGQIAYHFLHVITSDKNEIETLNDGFPELIIRRTHLDTLENHTESVQKMLCDDEFITILKKIALTNPQLIRKMRQYGFEVIVENAVVSHGDSN